ncbi:aminoglycoside phosphotransferase [Streptomyces sp. ISL-98]|uniref:phosphotransferase n=1 Tax=Streptomyces sp. ISL-98 TaxID=2819192 RepID=UPI001BE93430|nr:phosphotransferase [Streptomyces sp. ISL-98]MBT2507003.1 aminoglycoside phosphotransferase [Streptomyces sp. ISL-98]
MPLQPGIPGSAPGAHCVLVGSERVDWGDVPEDVRRAVEALTGPFRAAATASAGLNAQLAATLDVPGGKMFVNGMRRAHRSTFTLANEARVAPSVLGISPRLLHHGTAGSWEYLLFEHVDGQHADLLPRSPDLDPLAVMLRGLLGVVQHDTAASAPVEERWARFGGDLDLDLLAGDRLVHSDLNAGNILIGTGGAVLVDWALPARGASWLNVGFLLASLIGEGSTPAEAERWAQRTFPEWSAAGTTAVDTFVAALARRRAEQAADCPELRRASRQRQALLAQQWLRFRAGT